MKCPECGAEFEPKSVSVCGKQYFTQKRCDICAEVANERERLERAQNEAAELAARKAARWDKICPPEYREIDPGKLPTQRAKELLVEVRKWPFSPRGVMFGGQSGSAKTRLAYQLLRPKFDAGFSVEVLTPVAFRSLAAKAALVGGGLEDWIERFAKTDLLYFDDLGQMRLTESSEETLFELIERRCAHRKPIIASTQYQNEVFVAQFIRPERGHAIARRLMEFCEFIEL